MKFQLFHTSLPFLFVGLFSLTVYIILYKEGSSLQLTVSPPRPCGHCCRLLFLDCGEKIGRQWVITPFNVLNIQDCSAGCSCNRDDWWILRWQNTGQRTLCYISIFLNVFLSAISCVSHHDTLLSTTIANGCQNQRSVWIQWSIVRPLQSITCLYTLSSRFSCPHH